MIKQRIPTTFAAVPDTPYSGMSQWRTLPRIRALAPRRRNKTPATNWPQFLEGACITSNEKSTKVSFAYLEYSAGVAPDKTKAWRVSSDDADSKPGKLLGVVENERELRREHDRSFHRHVAICRFVQFLTGHPELAFNRAQDSPRKIPEGADGN